MTKIWIVMHYDEDRADWAVDYVASTEDSTGGGMQGAEAAARGALAEFKDADDTVIYWIGELHNA